MADTNLLDRVDTLIAINENPDIARLRRQPPTRNILGQPFAGIARGTLGVGEMAGEAISLLPGLRTVGSGIDQFFESMMPAPSGGLVEQAVESVTRTLGAGAALTAAGMAAGVSAPLTLAGIGTAALFGASEAAQTRSYLEGINQELISKGQAPLSPGEIREAMVANAAIEAVGEGVANYLFARRFGLGPAFDAAKKATQRYWMSGAVNSALKRVAGVAARPTATLGRKALASAVTEASTEAAQAAGQTAVLRSTIGEDRVPAQLQTPAESAREAAKVGALAGVFFTAGGHVINRRLSQNPQEPPATAEEQDVGRGDAARVRGEGFEILTPDEAARAEYQAAARAAGTAAKRSPYASDANLGRFATLDPDNFLSATGRSTAGLNYRDFIINEFLPHTLEAFRRGLRPGNIVNPEARAQFIENLNAALQAFPHRPIAGLLGPGRPPAEARFAQEPQFTPEEQATIQAQLQGQAPIDVEFTTPEQQAQQAQAQATAQAATEARREERRARRQARAIAAAEDRLVAAETEAIDAVIRAQQGGNAVNEEALADRLIERHKVTREQADRMVRLAIERVNPPPPPPPGAEPITEVTPPVTTQAGLGQPAQVTTRRQIPPGATLGRAGLQVGPRPEVAPEPVQPPLPQEPTVEVTPTPTTQAGVGPGAQVVTRPAPPPGATLGRAGLVTPRERALREATPQPAELPEQRQRAAEQSLTQPIDDRTREVVLNNVSQGRTGTKIHRFRIVAGLEHDPVILALAEPLADNPSLLNQPDAPEMQALRQRVLFLLDELDIPDADILGGNDALVEQLARFASEGIIGERQAAATETETPEERRQRFLAEIEENRRRQEAGEETPTARADRERKEARARAGSLSQKRTDMVSQAGRPYTSGSVAMAQLRRRQLDTSRYQVVEVRGEGDSPGGYVIRPLWLVTPEEVEQARADYGLEPSGESEQAARAQPAVQSEQALSAQPTQSLEEPGSATSGLLASGGLRPETVIAADLANLEDEGWLPAELWDIRRRGQDERGNLNSLVVRRKGVRDAFNIRIAYDPATDSYRATGPRNTDYRHNTLRKLNDQLATFTNLIRERRAEQQQEAPRTLEDLANRVEEQGARTQAQIERERFEAETGTRLRPTEPQEEAGGMLERQLDLTEEPVNAPRGPRTWAEAFRQVYDPLDKSKLPETDLELLDFIRRRKGRGGRWGINLAREGEIASEFEAYLREGGQANLINNKNGYSPQEMAELASERGFLEGNADKDALLRAIEESIAGNPQISAINGINDDITNAWLAGEGGQYGIREVAERYETPGGERPDADIRTRAMAVDGLRGLVARARGEHVETLGGVVIPGPRPIRLTARRGGGGTVELYRGIPDDSVLNDLRQTGRAAFMGRILRYGTRSLALIGQSVRNPRFETLYRVWVDAVGRVVNVEGLSSRLPGSAGAFLSRREFLAGSDAGEESARRELYRLRRRKQRMTNKYGPVSYYLLHNHPSGDPTPSVADMVMTNMMKTNLDGFLGHVVIDSGSFATIQPDATVSLTDISDILAQAGQETDPFLVPRDPAELPTIRTNRDVGRIGMALAQPGQVVAFFTAQDRKTKEHRIRGVQLIPERLFMSDQINGWLANRKAEYGTQNVGTYYEGQNNAVGDKAIELFQGQTIIEHIHQNPADMGTVTSLLESLQQPTQNVVPRTHAVQEPAEPFQREGQQRRFRAITPEIESKLYQDYAAFSNMFTPEVAAQFQQEFPKERISMPALDEEADAVAREWAANPTRFNTLLSAIRNGRAIANAAQIRAMQSISKGMYDDQFDRLEAGVINQEEFNTFLNQWFIMNGMVNSMMVSISEAGRILRAQRETPSVTAFQNLIAKMREDRVNMTEEQFQDFMDRANRAFRTGDRNLIRALGYELEPPSLRDYFMQFYYGSILSSLGTFSINFFSTFGFITLHNSIVRGSMGLLDPYVAKVQGRARQYYAQEALPSMAAAFKGIPKGIGRFWYMMRHRDVPPEASKFVREMERSYNAWERATYQRSIPELGIVKGQPIMWMRRLAPIISLASNALAAADVALREIAHDSDLAARATRASLQELGRRDRAYEQNYINTIDNRPAEQAAIKDLTDRLTFMDAPSQFATMFGRLQQTPVLGFFLGLLVPFKRTPDRLIARGLEFTPGVTMAPELWKRTEWDGWLPKIDFKANPDPQLTEVFAKQIIGAILAASFYALWKSGKITGDVPDDEAERATFFRQGKLPFSYISDDGTVVQWRRFEPISLPLGIAVSAFQAMDNLVKKREEEGRPVFEGSVGDQVDDGISMAALTAHSMVHFIIDGSYFRGIAEFMGGATQRPTGNIQRGLIRQFVTAVVPFVSAQRALNRYLDAQKYGEVFIRERETPLQEFQESVVGLGRTPPRLGAFGEPLSQRPTQSFEQLGVPPFRTSTIRQDAIERAMERAKFNPGLPRRRDVERSLNRTITDEEFRQYVQVRGQVARQTIERLVQLPFFRNLPAAEQRKRLSIAFRRGSREARRALGGRRRQRTAF